MPDLSKGTKRWERMKGVHRRAFGRPLKGKLLDFGCGAGEFMIAALRDGVNAYGVDVEEDRQAQFLALARREAPEAEPRFRLYDGGLLPFSSGYFDTVFSWFVFEHVTAPQLSLREIARVLKPGGSLMIFADDVRNGWDGHAAAPWPPYLPRRFAAAYAEGVGATERADARGGAVMAEFLTKSVVYVSAPDIAGILTTLGLEVLYAGPTDPKPATGPALAVASEAEARALGEAVRKTAPFTPPAENLTVFARKPL